MKHRLKWLIWGLAALFYFYEFVLRVSPSVLVNNLMHAFSITASTVGVISAFYLYSYAPMQLPVGILIDRYGVKRLLTAASVVCSLGAILFALSVGVISASAGRFLIGLGSAFAFVSMVYITSHWFAKRRRAFLIGVANSIAMLGASCGGGPLTMLVQNFGWRATIMGIGLFGLILSAFIYWSLKHDKEDEKIEHQSASHTPLGWGKVKVVFANWRSWINALVAICFYLTTTVFAGLWGVPFIQEAYGVSKTIAGYAMSLVFIGWLVGGPLIGWISDVLEKRVVVLRIGMLLAAISLSIVLYCTSIPIWLVYLLTFSIGLFSAGELLNFSISIDINPGYVKATAVAFTNFMVSVGDGIAQPAIGFFIDAFWTGRTANGIRVYDLLDYQYALSILPILLVVGFFLSFVLKESRE